jgi:hypothetical protein
VTAAEVQALYATAQCYRCYTNASEVDLLRFALLAQIAGVGAPITPTDAAALLSEVGCACYGFTEAQMLEFALLYDWLVAIGGNFTDQGLIDNAPCACVGISFFQTLKLSLLNMILEASGGSLPPDTGNGESLSLLSESGDELTTESNEPLLIES